MRNFSDRESYQRTRRATAEKRRVRLELEVLAWLRVQAIDQHAGAIARAIGVSSATVQRLLRGLARRGEVSSTRIGLGGRTFFRVVPPADAGHKKTASPP